MIDIDLAIEALKNKLSSMNYEEREAYIKKMGFSFGDEYGVKVVIQKESNEILKIWENFHDISNRNYAYFLAELVQILGYKEIPLSSGDEDLKLERSSTIQNNGKIIACIYPVIDFDRMLELLDTNEEKIKFLVQCREILNKYKEKRINENFENMTKKLL